MKQDTTIDPRPETSLAGQVLIAMPGLQDPEFANSVVYLCAHTDEGAMGIIVNRPLAKLHIHPGRLSSLSGRA